MEFNLAQVFSAVAAANPQRDCIVFGHRRFTYAQTAERARRFAGALHSWGFGAHRQRSTLAPHESGQSHLGLYMANCNEYLEAMLGAFKLRAVPVNINYRYVEDELFFLFDNADLIALLYPRELGARVAAVASRVPKLLR